MTPWKRIRIGLVSGLAVVGLLAGPATATHSESQSDSGWGSDPWTGTWATSVMRPSEGFEPSWAEEGFADQTVRQVVRVSAGGVAPRVRLSNVYGTTPLELSGATIARAAEGAAVRPGTLRHLRFGGHRTVVVPPGAEVTSDPVPLSVAHLESLTVTMYFERPTGPANYHMLASATSYRTSGDHRADVHAEAFTETSSSWYYLAGIEVVGLPPRRDAVVAFGDSITDGALSSVDANQRYPDHLAELFVERGSPRGVLNAGIGGNRLLTDAPCLGDAGVDRFASDALDQPGVRTVVVLLGVNDIGGSIFPPHPCVGEPPVVTADELIEGHRDLIRQAHGRGVTVVGATLLPFKGSFYDTEETEAVRTELNEWIRTSGEYDTVVDFDRIMAAPDDPELLDPAYDSGDGLHPNDAGYRAMAVAVADVLKLSSRAEVERVG